MEADLACQQGRWLGATCFEVHELTLSMAVCLVKSLDHPSQAWNTWGSWLEGRYRQVTLPESDLEKSSLTVVSNEKELKAMPEHSPCRQSILQSDERMKYVRGLNGQRLPIPHEEW